MCSIVSCLDSDSTANQDDILLTLHTLYLYLFSIFSRVHYPKHTTLHQKAKKRDLPPIQIILTKCDLVKQADLARRVVVVRQQLSDFLIREPSSLPVMLVSSRAGLGSFNNSRGKTPLGGLLELQIESRQSKSRLSYENKRCLNKNSIYILMVTLTCDFSQNSPSRRRERAIHGTRKKDW